jgi:uncharacterized protein (DUF2147 family)
MMKRFIALCCALVLGVGMGFAADVVEGFWVSVDEKTGKATAGWEIYQEGGKLYGRILSIADFPQTELASACKAGYKDFPAAGKVNEMQVVGTTWLYGLTMNNPGQWSGGSIVDPNNGNLYKCKITYHTADGKRYKGDTLEMRGEIGLGIGRSQYWRKSTREEAGSLR